MAFESLSQVDATSDGLQDLLDSMDARARGISVREIGRQVAAEMRLDVVAALLTNYERSGLVARTGNLRRAITNSIVEFHSTTGGGMLRVRMPPSQPPYTDKNNKSSKFYTVAASLNFGAVIVKKETRTITDLSKGTTKREKRSVIGAKAKRTVKKFALGQAVSGRAINAVEEGMRKGTAKERRTSKVTGKSYQYKKGTGRKIIGGFHVGQATDNGSNVSLSGGATVIKPKKFYYFTEAQKHKLSSFFFARFSELMLEAFGNAA